MSGADSLVGKLGPAHGGHELAVAANDLRQELSIHQCQSLGNGGFTVAVLNDFPVTLGKFAQVMTAWGGAFDFRSAQPLPGRLGPRTEVVPPLCSGDGIVLFSNHAGKRLAKSEAEEKDKRNRP